MAMSVPVHACVEEPLGVLSLHFLTAEGQGGNVWVGPDIKMLLLGSHGVKEPGKWEMTQFVQFEFRYVL